MSKSYIIYVLIFLSSHSSIGQQVPLNNHYLVNPFVLNPAETGSNSNTNINLIRNQRFGGFEGATINNYLTVDGKIMKEKGGIGFQLAQQQHGIQQQISSSLSYAYGIRLLKDHYLRFGVSAGLLDNRIDKAAINVLQIDDPYLMTMRSNVSSFDMNVGLLYNYNHLKVGISVPQILGNKISYDPTKSRGYYRLSRHFMSLVQYDYDLNESIRITPAALIRMAPGAPIQYDLTAQATYLKKYWASVTYKSNYAIQFNIGLQLLEQFKLGYSYELITGSIKNYTSGIHHEILIGYTFKQTSKKQEIIQQEIIRDTIIQTVMIEDKNQINRLKELENQLRESLIERDSLKKELNSSKLNETIENNSKADTSKQLINKTIDSTTDKSSVKSKPSDDSEEVKDKDLIRDSEFYTFIELDASNSPDGYYVISGVYSSRNNAEKELERIKFSEPNVYMVISTSNNFYYLVILLTNDRKEALDKCRISRELVNEKTWILDYRKN